MSRFLRVWPGPLGADHAVDLVWVNGAVAVGEGTDHHRGAYLDAGFDDDAALTASSLALRGHHDVEIVEDDESWWDGWRDHARPVTCLDIVVNPAWRPRPPVSAGATVLDIDPGRSFGSGAHVTTQLALEALQTQRLAGARVLDVGSGSGVLGIAAALLGASAVTAVDTDPAALVATAANAARNGVQGVVVIGDVGSGGLDDLVEVFDVVLANVPTPTVIDLASAMARRLAPGGRLVVTGFLTAREVAVVAAFAPPAPFARSERDGWACVVLGAANRP